MQTYAKPVLSEEALLEKLIAHGMHVGDKAKAARKLNEIGYYRLRGYAFQLYDHETKRYQTGTTFEQVLGIYRFDAQLRSLLFNMSCQIEVALRTRFCEAMLKSDDAMAHLSPAYFEDKVLYWQNTAALASEIARSKDVFIAHHFDRYEGEIPLWAAVEVMSFGTLSKYIKNMRADRTSLFPYLAEHYAYDTTKAKQVSPSKNMLSSWIHAVSVMRNICAHNARIYNRTFSTRPVLLKVDQIYPQPRYSGLYQCLLAMKYLRPQEKDWHAFVLDFRNLLILHRDTIDTNCLNLPDDWLQHLLTVR